MGINEFLRRRNDIVCMSFDNKEIYSHFDDRIHDKRFASKSPLRRHAHLSQYESILRQVQPGETVLDAGCGDGVLSCLLAQRGVRVVGVDISEPNIEAAKRRAAEWGVSEQTEFTLGDAEELPFPDESFGTVISCHVLEHLPDFYRGLSEVRRVTSRRAIIALPTMLNPCSVIQVGHGSFWEISRRSLLAIPWGLLKTATMLFTEGVNEGYVGRKELTHIFRYPWVMRGQLREAGFIIDHFEASTLILPFFPALLPLIKRLDTLRDKPFFRNFGYGSTAVLTKS